MHVASIRDVKFLPVIFYVNFPDGLILSHVLHSFSHLMKLLRFKSGAGSTHLADSANYVFLVP